MLFPSINSLTFHIRASAVWISKHVFVVLLPNEKGKKKKGGKKKKPSDGKLELEGLKGLQGKTAAVALLGNVCRACCWARWKEA